MNYRKLYDFIVMRGKNRNYDGYTETHHIIPKCLGGRNTKDNLTKLTAKEHFIVHHLLTKIHPNNPKILYAYTMMLCENKYQNRYITARHYDKLKMLKSSLTSGEKNPNWKNKTGGAKGYKHSEETKKLLSEQKLGKTRASFKRCPATEETKAKISAAKKGKPITYDRTGMYVGEKNPMFGKKHSEETKEKMRKKALEKCQRMQ